MQKYLVYYTLNGIKAYYHTNDFDLYTNFVKMFRKMKDQYKDNEHYNVTWIEQTGKMCIKECIFSFVPKTIAEDDVDEYKAFKGHIMIM